MEIWEEVSLRLIPKDYVANWHYWFVDHDLKVFFDKYGTAERLSIDFEIVDWDTYALALGLKISHGACLFYCSFGDKKRIAFKNFLDLYCHSLIIDFSWFV